VPGELDDDAGQVRPGGEGLLDRGAAEQVRADGNGEGRAVGQQRDGGQRLGDRQRLELGGQAAVGGGRVPDVGPGGPGKRASAS
jgi:hypothetical protein